MTWIIWIGLLGVIGLVGFVACLIGRGSNNPETKSLSGLGLILVPIVVVVLGVGSTIYASAHQVPAGYVGVVYQFEDIVGQTEAGLVWTKPWQSVTNANTQIQTLCFSDAEQAKCPDGAKQVGPGLDSFSEETQNVFIDAVLRISVDPEDVQGLYRKVGPNYVNKLIPGSIAQVFKDETVNYRAVDIAPNREAIRRDVENAIKRELNRFSISVDALLIENISFEQSFEDAIQAKQNASQEALREEELVKAETAKADQKIEKARGTGEAIRIEAVGQAKANELLAASLTPEVIQFEMIQQIVDDITIMLLPAGDGFLLDPSQLIGSASQPKPEGNK